jgi:glyoxylase-like metal-dependent hydrolase (beta-lactamase superfamily II)
MSETEQQSPPAPVVRGRPVEIAEGVFVIPDGRVPLVPNIGIVLGTRSALVVDTAMGPRNGEVVLDHARRLAGDRPLILTVTHFHPEHAFGAQVFAGQAAIVYNRAQREELRRKGPGYIEMFRGFGESVAESLEGTELVDPDVVYEGEAEIDLGGRIARLLTWGLAHTGADQVVFLPEERLLFGGDLFETRMFPIVPYFPPDDVDVDGQKWMDVLDRLLELDPAVVVPGHGEVTDTSVIRGVHEYFSHLQAEVGRLKAAGRSADEAIAELEPATRERWADWDNPEWIGFAVRLFHDRA